MSFGFVEPKKTGNLKHDISIFFKTLSLRLFGWSDIIKRLEFNDWLQFINLKKDEKVLEVGSGSPSIYALELAKYTKEYIASDIADITYHNNWNIPSNLKAVQCDVYKLPFQDNQFDKVLISETLPLLETPDIALNEISRVLKNGSSLYLINGSTLSYFENIYNSNNLFFRLIKNIGSKLDNIPCSYDEFYNYHISLHKSSKVFFDNREEYFDNIFSNSHFSLIKHEYTLHSNAMNLFQIIFFIYIAITGKKLQPKWFIVFFPFIKLFNKKLEHNEKGFCIMTEVKNIKTSKEKYWN